jgi:hypothetical protein
MAGLCSRWAFNEVRAALPPLASAERHQRRQYRGIVPKDVENRNWTSDYRGPLLIHTGRNVDPDLFDRQGRLDHWYLQSTFGSAGLHLRDRMPQLADDYPRGAIIGQARLSDVVTRMGGPWFVGHYGFVLKDVRVFEQPVLYPGSLGLFDVPLELVPEYRAGEQPILGRQEE